MSVYFFTKLFYLLLLFLLMCCTLCVIVYASRVSLSSPESDTFELFNKNKITGAQKPNEKLAAKEIHVKEYYSPFLIATKELMIAMAGANYTEGSAENNIGILTRYIKIGKGWGEKAVTSFNSDWVTQLAVQNKEEKSVGDTFIMKSLLAVAKENKIYVLLVNYTEKKLPSESPVWEFKVVVGNVNIKKESDQTVVWNDKTLPVAGVAEKLKEKLNGGKLADYHFSGLAFLTKEKIMFALVVTYNNKNMTALLHLNNDAAKTGFEHKEIDESCYSLFFPWKEKIIMVPVDCGDVEKKKIMELNEDEQQGKKSTEQFLKYYNFLKNKKNFVTIKNETTEILLFTEHRRTSTKKQDEEEVYLWMSDGTRFKRIGKISDDSKEVSLVNFLFADGKLYSLNQQLESSTKKIEGVKLKYLKDQSTKIKDTISAWSTTDAEVLKLCKRQYASEIPCVTNGLVGFLFNNKDGDTTWKNEYLNMDATVTPAKGKAEKIENGFKFSGKGAGAKWVLSDQSKDQPYNFIDPGFTLVATVSVGKNTKDKKISIFGASLTENAKVSLWCTTDGKWGVSEKDGQTNKKSSEINCTREKTYYVALTLRNNNEISVYVNGKQLSKINIKEIQITLSQDAAYFYFGADSNANEIETDVNITNVLLYNLPFEEEKINELKPKETTVADSQQATQPKNGQTATPGDSTEQTDQPASTSATKNEKEEAVESSPPNPTTEDSAARVGVVGVLCFMLFGVFTLLGRYVY